MRKVTIGVLLLVIFSAGCIESGSEPLAPVARASDIVDGNCATDDPQVFRPECTAAWSEGLSDHTTAINAAISAARNHVAQYSETAYVLLKSRTYTYSGVLNPGELYNPPGIVIRNEYQQQNTILATSDPQAAVRIQGGDVFQYLVFRGPYYAAANDTSWWQGSNICAAGGEPGINGSLRNGWVLFESTSEGYGREGVHMSGSSNAIVSHTTIQKNLAAGIQVIEGQYSITSGLQNIPAANNIIQHNVIRFNGGNGIDINGDANQIRFNNTSYNGWISCTNPWDRNGIFVWGVPEALSNGVLLNAIVSSDNIIEHNQSFNNGLDGINVSSTGATSHVHNNAVRTNHAFSNNRNGIFVSSTDNGLTDATTVSFNTIMGNGSSYHGFADIKVEAFTGGATSNTSITQNVACVTGNSAAYTIRSANACAGSFDSDVTEGPVTVSKVGWFTWTTSAQPGHSSNSYEWRNASTGALLGYGPSLVRYINPCTEPSSGFTLRLVVINSVITEQLHYVDTQC